MASSAVMTIGTVRSFGFYLITVPSEPSSQFRALAYHDCGAQSGHSAIRSRIIDHMRLHPTHYHPLMGIKVGDLLRRNPSRTDRSRDTGVATQEHVDGAYSLYLDKTAENTHRGDDITLQAFATAFHVDVVVVKHDRCEVVRAVATNGQEAMKTVVVAYDEGTQHYSAVDTKEKKNVNELLAKLAVESTKDSSTPKSLGSEAISPHTNGDDTPLTTKTTPEASATPVEEAYPKPIKKESPLPPTSNDDTPSPTKTAPAESPKAVEVVSPKPAKTAPVASPKPINKVVPPKPTPKTITPDLHIVQTKRSLDSAHAWIFAPTKRAPKKKASNPPHHQATPEPARPATTEPRKLYLYSSAKKKDSFVTQKRKRTVEDLCLAAPKKKKEVNSRSSTPVSTGSVVDPLKVNTAIKTTSTSTKRPAASVDDAESSSAKKQKLVSTAVPKAAPKPFNPFNMPERKVKAPPKPAASTATPSTALDQAAAPKAVAGPNGRVYKIERIPLPPKPEPIKQTTFPKAPSTRKATSPLKPAHLSNAFTKTPKEMEYVEPKRAIKPVTTRHYEPPTQGSNVFVIGTAAATANPLEPTRLLKKDMMALPMQERAKAVRTEELKARLRKNIDQKYRGVPSQSPPAEEEK